MNKKVAFVASAAFALASVVILSAPASATYYGWAGATCTPNLDQVESVSSASGSPFTVYNFSNSPAWTSPTWTTPGVHTNVTNTTSQGTWFDDVTNGYSTGGSGSCTRIQ